MEQGVMIDMTVEQNRDYVMLATCQLCARAYKIGMSPSGKIRKTDVRKNIIRITGETFKAGDWATALEITKRGLARMRGE